jgi:hypothetical protein
MGTTVTNNSKVSGAFVASESCANAGTYTNTWTVADCGNTSEVFTQIITIQIQQRLLGQPLLLL